MLLEHISADTLRHLGLRLTEPGEPADVIAREPRFPESAFRGAVDHDGVRVADVLQCWLDVANTQHVVRRWQSTYSSASSARVCSSLIDDVAGPRSVCSHRHGAVRLVLLLDGVTAPQDWNDGVES